MTFSLKASRRLMLAQIVAHCIAGGAVLATAWHWFVQMFVLAIVGVSLLRFLWRSPAFVKLHLGSKGEFEVETKVGVRRTAEILPETVVLPTLVLLVLKMDGQRAALVLPQDALDGDAHRQLRTWLKCRVVSALK